MNAPRHILITGERGAGKSTLIEKLLLESAKPVYGFVTKRLAPDGSGFHPIYMHPAWESPAQRRCTPENLVGTCDAKTHNVSPGVFETLGVRLIEAAKPGGIIVMDELGFMEAQATRFTSAVLRALDGSIPVLAAVKARYDVDFLNAVRAHENCDVFTLTKENRDVIYAVALKALYAWDER